MPLSRLIGSRLRDQRLALGLRQSEVAAKAGLSASFLNLIEHNRRRISAAGLERVAAVLGCTADQLGGADEASLAIDLRTMGAGTGGELDRTEEFILRFPGWAQALSGMTERAALLERAVGALNDRLAHDPYLSQSLHDLLSALSAVRSTAAILVETPDIEPDWQARFHQNLHLDSERMARGAEALVAYLDGSEGDPAMTMASPQEEVDAWLAAQGWHLAGLEENDLEGVLADTDMLGSAAARVMARAWVRCVARDVAALPLSDLQRAMGELGSDALRLAARLGANPLAVFRRIATLPRSDLGLVICDGSGGLVFRKPARGFSIPRFGAACPLWPLFNALRRPMTAVEQRVSVTGRTGEGRYLLRAYAQLSQPLAYGAPELCEAAMLIQPEGPGVGSDHAFAVGMSCRICVQKDCLARREPSILSGL